MLVELLAVAAVGFVIYMVAKKGEADASLGNVHASIRMKRKRRGDEKVVRARDVMPGGHGPEPDQAPGHKMNQSSTDLHARVAYQMEHGRLPPRGWKGDAKKTQLGKLKRGR